ncbi:MAG TPA: acyl-ACP thioesterase domain-containing protein [Candidatus Limnocylindrales bacterium]|nr:acyl-ACP thioesterase domain-containing protein [Candidatus Limnocylindrales bacterium]
MTAPVRIERPFRVRFDECGIDGLTRASSLLRWAQDVAWVHSAEAGFDRRWYAERGLAWLVRCLRLDLLRAPESGQTVSVSTEVVGWRRVWARRSSEIRAQPASTPAPAASPATEPGASDLLATVVTDWVLLGPSGLPVRVPSEITAVFAARLPSFEPGRVPLLEPPSAADPVGLDLAVRRQELDPMGHVNHAVYLDWLEEAVAAAGGQDDLIRLPRRYRLEYDRSAEPGARLRAEAWRHGPGWAFRLIDEQAPATTGGADRRALELSRARLEVGRT